MMVPMPSLTHAEAIARAALIHDLAYELDLDLTGGRTFRSTTVLGSAWPPPAPRPSSSSCRPA